MEEPCLSRGQEGCKGEWEAVGGWAKGAPRSILILIRAFLAGYGEDPGFYSEGGDRLLQGLEQGNAVV